MALELKRIDPQETRYRVEAPNGDEFFIRPRSGQWGAWRWDDMGGPNHDREPDYQHAQLTYLVAEIEAKERPLGERFDAKVRESIDAGLKSIGYIAKQIGEIDREATKRKQPFRERSALLQEELLKVIGGKLDIPPGHLALGYYDCATSPTDQCIYNHREDPMHDQCLFCHDPSERK